MNPNLKLAISARADVENAQNMVRGGQFVRWFLPSDLDYILSKKFTPKERDKIINEYTRESYKNRKKEIKLGVEKTQKEWGRVAAGFYKLAAKIFQKHPWPNGHYTGYASIYFMFPRDIASRVFYFPYDRRGDLNPPIRVIGHEMLHFIFFDFIKKKYNLSEQSKYVWQVSEVFNNVIENWEPYTKLLRSQKKAEPYPGCEKIYQKMRQQWAKSQDINKLLDNFF